MVSTNVKPLGSSDRKRFGERGEEAPEVEAALFVTRGAARSSPGPGLAVVVMYRQPRVWIQLTSTTRLLSTYQHRTERQRRGEKDTPRIRIGAEVLSSNRARTTLNARAGDFDRRRLFCFATAGEEHE